MNQKLRSEAEQIMEYAIGKVLPDRAVVRALEACDLSGRIYLAAIGKAAWQMANAAVQYLKTPVAGGVVVTKYGHVKGDIPGMRCFEGGHPIPDENGLAGTQAILDMTANLTQQDHVLFLVSGGGSALFEKPLVPLAELQELNRQLLAAGASITEINTLRKRLSAVKGGRFAKWCEPARIDSIILSDVLGDPLDMIASGPAAPDPTTCGEALAIVEKYHLNVTKEALSCLGRETPKELGHVTSHVIGSVRQLCQAAAEKCRELGYEVHILTDRLCCEAREAGWGLAAIARSGQLSEASYFLAQSGLLSEERSSAAHSGLLSEESTVTAQAGLLLKERGSATQAGLLSEERGSATQAGLLSEERGSATQGGSPAEERISAVQGSFVPGERLTSAKGTLLPENKACQAVSGSLSAGKASAAGNSPISGRKAYIAGGECVVHLHGNGLGGRNQELALAAAEGLAGIPNAALFSVGSDGTDGPTDAAGGYVDGESFGALEAKGIQVQDALARNDSYHALDAIGGLLKTGPTGTNVNDFSVLLINA